MNKPKERKKAPSNSEPQYAPRMGPGSGVPRTASIKGIVRVPAKALRKNVKLAANLPSTSSCGCMGNVSSISQVFCLRSSAHSRMVTAGRKMHIKMGTVEKKARMSALRNVKNGVINNPTLRLRNTMRKM